MKFLDYIKGIRKGKDAHRIEYDAMSDPFWADAIEGFDSIEGDHANRIAQMQARIAAKTTPKKKKSGVWRIAVAAVAFIAVLTGYFTLMNHETSMVVASCDNCFINIYAPEDYIERKRLELTLQQEVDPAAQATAIVNIENLRDVIAPVERMTVYIPGNYAYSKSTKSEEEELRFYEHEMLDAQKQKTQSAIEEVISSEMNINPSMDVAFIESPRPVPVQAVAESSMGRETVLSDEKFVAEGRLSSSSNVLSEKKQSSRNIDVARANAKIRGRIVDEINEPIVGAIVIVKGTSTGVVTDFDGYYDIKVDSQTAPLIASFLGYESVEIPDPSKAKVVAMKPDNQSLSEVVVTGYGARKKSSMTGAVSSISSSSVDFTKKIVSKPVIGFNAYNKYLKDNQQNPKDVECTNKKGKVILEFFVGTSGRPYDIKVVKSLCDELDQDAIDLVDSGSDWTHSTEKVKLEIKY